MKNIKDRDYLRHIDEINSIMKGSGIIFMYMGIPISMRNTKEDIMKILLDMHFGNNENKYEKIIGNIYIKT